MPELPSGGVPDGGVHQEGEAGLPSPAERPVLELQGKDAELVMRILKLWAANERRRLELLRTRQLWADQAAEHRLAQRDIERVEKWVREWGVLAGSSEKKGISE